MNQRTRPEFHFTLLQEGLREYFRLLVENAQQENALRESENDPQSACTRALEMM